MTWLPRGLSLVQQNIRNGTEHVTAKVRIRSENIQFQLIDSMTSPVRLSDFTLAVTSCFFGKDPYTSTKHVFYTLQSRRRKSQSQDAGDDQLELTDSTTLRYSHLLRWHKKMCRKFSNIHLPPFPQRPLSMLKLTRELAKTSGDLNVFKQINEMRNQLTEYFRSMQRIERIANSFEFQRILPKSCHLREKKRNQGILVNAIEQHGFLRAQKLTININQKLKLIRLTTLTNASHRQGRENISFTDLQSYSVAPEGGKLKCILTLRDGLERTFKFGDPADLDYFLDALRSSAPQFRMRASRTATIAEKTIGYIQKMRSALRNSMLSENPVEMESLKEISVFVSTWNLARTNITNFGEHLLAKSGKNFDILAFGFQECRTFNGSVIHTESRIAQHLSEVLGHQYTMVARKALWEINIVVFAKKELRKQIHNVEAKSLATGFLGVVGNKGACAVSMRVHQTSICFVTSHLSPHQRAVVQRNEMYKEIVSNLRIGNPLIDLNLQFDKVFWFGDLNYRIDLSSVSAAGLADRGLWSSLLKKDQLLLEMSENRCFSGFEEPLIEFAPSYKWKMKIDLSEGSESVAVSDESEDSDCEFDFENIKGRQRSCTNERMFLDFASTDGLEGTMTNSVLSGKSNLFQSPGRHTRSISDASRSMNTPMSQKTLGSFKDDDTEGSSLGSNSLLSMMDRVHLGDGTLRSYDLKRVPSYTDRVLYCSNAYSGGLQGITVDSYSDVSELVQSDHNAVTCSFKVAVLESVPSSVYNHSVEMYIGNVSIDFFQGFHEFRHARHVFLCFHGPLMTEPVFSGISMVKQDEFGDNIDLSDISIPSLRLKMGDLYYLRYKRLFVSVCFTEDDGQRVWSKESISMQASIPFFLRENSSSSRIDSLLYSKGILSGCIHGSVVFDRK